MKPFISADPTIKADPTVSTKSIGIAPSETTPIVKPPMITMPTSPPGVSPLDVVKEIPSSVAKVGKGLLNFGKDVFQGINRSGGSFVAQVLKPITGLDTITPDDSWSGKAQKLLFGDKPIETLDLRVENAIKQGKDLQKKYNLPKITPTVFGLVGGALPTLDFLGLGGEEGAIKLLARLTKVEDVANILRKINVSEDIIKSYAPIIAKTTKEAEVGKIVSHIADLQKTTQGVKDAVSNLPKLATQSHTEDVIQAMRDLKLAQETNPIVSESKLLGGEAPILKQPSEVLPTLTGKASEVGATKPIPVDYTQFYSPNIEKNLTFEEATKRLDSQRQALIKSLAEDINRQGGATITESSHVIGDTKSYGTENALFERGKIATVEDSRYIAAQKGLVGNQESVLNFIKDTSGKDNLYILSHDLPDSTLRKILDDAGLEYRTFDKGRVMVYDEGKSLESTINNVTKEINGKLETIAGTGEFIGGNSRTEGLQAYRKIINEYEQGRSGVHPNSGLSTTAAEGSALSNPDLASTIANAVPANPQITSPPIVPPSLPPIGNVPPSGMKERGLLTSLKENPLTGPIFQNFQDYYSVLPNTESINKARTLMETNPQLAKELAYSDKITTEAQATRLLMLTDAVKRGDFAEASRLGELAPTRATEAGQAAQINAILNQSVDSPEKAIFTAGQNFHDYAQKVVPYFENKVNQVGKEIDKIQKDAVETIIKETPELTPKVSTGEIPKLNNLAKKLAENKGASSAEQLAKRINVLAKSPKPNPVKDMVDELYKIAQELLPKKGIKPPKNQIEVIGKALRDKDTYKDVWLKAQDLVRTKYKDNPKALELLDEYFGKTMLSGETVHATLPISQGTLNTAVNQGIKSSAIDLDKIVRDHYTVVDQTGKDLTTKLVEQANVPPKEAMALTQKIQARFKELTEAKKSSILKTMLAEHKVPEAKSFADRMIEMSNLGAFDKTEFRQALATKLKLPVLTEDLAKQLSEQAQVIAKTSYGYEKVKETEKLLKLISDQMPITKAERVGQWINIPRTMMSSFDLSFGLRQGAFIAPSFPKEFASAFGKQFKMFGSEKAYEAVMDATMKNPLFSIAEQSGVAFTDLGTKMGLREERIMSPIVERIPWLGAPVRASARAYTGMANKLRMDVFASMYKDAERLGRDMSDPKLLKDMAEFVNNSTGRGSKIFGMDITKSAPLLNGLFFSPRLMASRLTLITDPSYYIKADPLVRKQALKSLLTFAGTGMTVLGLASLMGAEVGSDPRSADFGKIKVGNTRLDIFGGFQQYVRMAAQLSTGQYVSSTTGKVTTLGEGYKPLTRWDILWRQVESKEAPVMSFITALLKQQDYTGQPISIPKEVVNRFTPMIFNDLHDIVKDDPNLLPLGLLSTFGIGVQTYPSKNTAKMGAFGSGTTKSNKTKGKMGAFK